MFMFRNRLARLFACPVTCPVSRLASRYGAGVAAVAALCLLSPAATALPSDPTKAPSGFNAETRPSVGTPVLRLADGRLAGSMRLESPSPAAMSRTAISTP